MFPIGGYLKLKNLHGTGASKWCTLTKKIWKKNHIIRSYFIVYKVLFNFFLLKI